MNSIPEKQNEEFQLRRLAAQRQLYSTAKRIFSWQVIAGGPTTVGLAFMAFAFPSIKSYAALWGILVSLSDLTWLTPWQKRLRTSAAQIQEQFDCEVLDLPWNDMKVGRPPHPELVAEQADKYSRWSTSMPSLVDWYPKEVGSIPLPIARLICQRQNCWWDANQRRRYALAVVGSVLVVFLLVLVLSMREGLTIEGFLVGVLVPLAPALLLGYRQFTEQTEAANRLDSLREHAERLWADALAGVPQSVITARARILQDEIFDNRRRSPLVFDAAFKHLRADFELLMNQGASHYIAEAKRKLGLP